MERDKVIDVAIAFAGIQAVYAVFAIRITYENRKVDVFQGLIPLEQISEGLWEAINGSQN